MSRVWYPMILEVGEKDVVKGGNKKEKLDGWNTEIDKKFHELCDRLHAKYKNKLVFITNIYKTI